MTRGQLILLLGNNQFIHSVEFNGDMYPPFTDKKGNEWAGLGSDALAMLSKVTNVAEYQQAVADFNNKYFGYDDEKITFKGHGKQHFDLTKSCFNNLYSDYLYMKNISNEDVTFIAYAKRHSKKKVQAIIPAHSVGVFNFDYIADTIKHDIIISNFEETVDNEQLCRQITNYMVEVMKHWQSQSPQKIINKINFGNLYLLDDLRFLLENINITSDKLPKVVKTINDNEFPQTVISFADHCENYPFIDDNYSPDDFLHDLEEWLVY